MTGVKKNLKFKIQKNNISYNNTQMTNQNGTKTDRQY